MSDSIRIVLNISLVVGIYLATFAFMLRAKWRLARLAAFFGLFGALPGFLIEMVPHAFQQEHISFWALITLPIPYFFFGVPLTFGPFCIVAALTVGVIIRLTQESPHKWLPPVAIVILPMLAAIPISVFGFKPLDTYGCSAFWSIAMLVFRKRIFGDAALEPSPKIHALYNWLTQYR